VLTLVLEANHGLAEKGAVYPAGIHIVLPEITQQVSESPYSLWVRIPLYSITDWHRSPISDSHPFDQPGT
ncbi:tail protein X, partial [Escherichia coli]|uniref:tail protein X n=1 Tax=Escherichia coli TaxID=562 RepID=UPI002026CCE2